MYSYAKSRIQLAYSAFQFLILIYNVCVLDIFLFLNFPLLTDMPVIMALIGKCSSLVAADEW